MDPFETAFPFLDTEQRERLRSAGTERTFAPGDAIVEEGAPFEALHVVERGSVSVERSHLGGTIPLRELGPGALLGEIALLDGSPASASVFARTEVVTRALAGVESVFASDPALAGGFYRSLAVVLARRLRYGNEDRVVSMLQWG
jgi:CRP-like cAMP-binding protein